VEVEKARRLADAFAIAMLQAYKAHPACKTAWRLASALSDEEAAAAAAPAAIGATRKSLRAPKVNARYQS
jgi:hypothetical protein